MTEAIKKHALIRIIGQVQGVFFRATAKTRADELNITGFVKNEDDGSVSIVAEGNEEYLLQFVEWCKKGPPLAIVEKAEIVWSDHLGRYKTFEVL